MNDVVIRHIPHEYSAEMSKKSDTVSMFMLYDVLGIVKFVLILLSKIIEFF